MARAKNVTNGDGSPYGIRFNCPGCGDKHAIPTTGSHAWGFNGSLEMPTLTPSVLVTYTGEDDGKPVREVCHSFVTDGRIQFLGDCTHDKAGQTVDLPEVE